MRKIIIKFFVVCFMLTLMIANYKSTAAAAAEYEPIVEIESENIYEGMESSYSQGYKPTVQDGKVTVVLPLASDQMFYDGFTVTADVSTSSPLIAVNQLKKINYSHFDSTIGKYIFIAEFVYELAEQYNAGTYMVDFFVDGYDYEYIKRSYHFSVNVILKDTTKSFGLKTVNDKAYEGMNASYQDGYIPTVYHDTATVILPILVEGEYNGKLTASVRTTDSSVFTGINYSKTFSKQRDGNYLITFDLPLNEDRKNGSYPVEFTVTADDSSYNFTVYVVINEADDIEHKISLINDKVYEGMDCSYQDGYIPMVLDDSVNILLPLSVEGGYSKELTVSARAADSSVFEGINYSKTINPQSDHSYLVQFLIPLKKDRKNGTYPVEFTVTSDNSSFSYTVYVVISDQQTSGFRIDNMNVYNNMNLSYADGYKPFMSNEKAVVVLPIMAECEMQGDLKVKAEITDNTNTSFEIRNYEKDVSLSDTGVYLIQFEFNLLSTRKNGVYPIKFTVSGKSITGETVSETFTIYATISDVEESEDTNEVPSIIVESFTTEEFYNAGEQFTGSVVFKNMNKKASAYNIQIRVSSQSQGIEFLNNTNVVYFEDMPSNSLALDLNFKAQSDTAAGRHSINLDLTYEDENGSQRSSSAVLYINIKQVASVLLETNGLDNQIAAGDTVTLSADVYNLGKGSIYNITLKVEGYGLLPSKSGYVGKMNPESSEGISIDVFVGSKTMSSDYSGTEKYGFTQGKLILSYEDEEGNEYMEEYTISTQIAAPVSSSSTSSTNETESSWWISLVSGGCILLFTGVYLFFVKRRSKWSSV